MVNMFCIAPKPYNGICQNNRQLRIIMQITALENVYHSTKHSASLSD